MHHICVNRIACLDSIYPVYKRKPCFYSLSVAFIMTQSVQPYLLVNKILVCNWMIYKVPLVGVIDEAFNLMI